MTAVRFNVNGTAVEADASVRRLSEFLRETLGLTATKVGCDAGDCGACTVIVDGEAAAACMVPVGRLTGAEIETLEGLDATGEIDLLQRSFLHHGAAQCGICTPGMLVAACALLRTDPGPTAQRIQDALGGVLCRCTGYRKIIDAVGAAPAFDEVEVLPPVGKAVGDRLARVDGKLKIQGSEVFGADAAPDGALLVRVVRSPFHRARFTLGDLDGYVRTNPGVEAVFTADDVPGLNRFGVIPGLADQPVFAERETRFRGEAVAMVVGQPDVVEGLDLGTFPVTWEELPPLMGVKAARDEGAALVHADREGNVLIRGNVRRGDLDAAFEAADVVVEAAYETSFVEHAYIEPEAGFAERIGDRVEVQVTTQSPHMDREALEEILGLPAGSVRIRPTAVGGGFGSKLDLSVQPYVAIAAWNLGRPVRITYTRPESMMSTTKRHPAQMRVRIGATRDGRLKAMDFFGRFDTGAYASWGPTVAARVPVHAGGPYVYDAYRARSEAVHTNAPPSGAFRGFGVPQSTIASETLLDDLAHALGMDGLELRFRNALTAGRPTVTGQVFEAGVGYRDCLDALRPHWERARADAARGQRSRRPRASRRRDGRHVVRVREHLDAEPLDDQGRPAGRRAHRAVPGCGRHGPGSEHRDDPDLRRRLGRPRTESGDADGPDTDTTPDAGKSSASRQTFVSGNATFLAATRLRADLLAMAGASSEESIIELEEGSVVVRDRGRAHPIDLAALPADHDELVAVAQATFDPPTTPLDADGQGAPYAMFGYGAHLAEVEVDTALGTVRVVRITAVHDVGRAVNPTLVEGQIEGGVAQGIGMALMEEYVPGRTENLHDYLIPTIGDVPEVVSILVESNDPVGPYGAKGIGEHTLVPTAPAILNAIRDAVGAPVRHVPATPERVLAAIAEGAR